jgi:hypothetical protein
MLHLNVLRQLLHFSKIQFKEIINFHAHMNFSKYHIFLEFEKFISQLWKKIMHILFIFIILTMNFLRIQKLKYI